MLSRRGNEIPREGRFSDEIRLCRQMDILLSTVMSTTGGRVSIDRYVSHAILSLIGHNVEHGTGAAGKGSQSKYVFRV